MILIKVLTDVVSGPTGVSVLSHVVLVHVLDIVIRVKKTRNTQTVL